MKFHTIIFDLGGVLVDWNPKYVFNDHYFASESDRAYFFDHVCTPDWNEEQDAGRSIVEATNILISQFPEWEAAIRDFYGRWTDMLGGPIRQTVDILKTLKIQNQQKLYALTNWQAGLFEIALVKYDFLHWFDGIVVSGVEKTRKPFPDFYKILLDRYEVDHTGTIFIDDNIRNVEAARALGIYSIHFTKSSQLGEELKQLGILH